MNELSLPIDPCNPGHFYACCGLMELFQRGGGAVTSRFLIDSHTARIARFELVSQDSLYLTALMNGLKTAAVEYLDRRSDGALYENAVRPVRLQLPSGELVLDWWFDWFRDRTKDLKCWAGQVTTEKLMSELQSCLQVDRGPGELFHAASMMKTKFGIDPRSAWSSLDVGYSPNEHGQDAATFPAVELLGAIGLQGFRPYLKKRDNVRFHLWTVWLGTVPARRAAIDPWGSAKAKSFRFQIAKRGQSYKYFTFAVPVEDTKNDD
jgi:CRISPR-associated protein Csx14